ncbi:histidine-specific methyltransferase [Suillus fuscotomentosus]|uniref:Histidine-specific methyltransferase n=1 Tax=Suillus fuscotomentosus TaxID=1912939 RepID=A0AAD4HM79_9AGAM|nr:histidine-specific methyltransferase [Suillus fuscotomentosus]KAG1901346.1 histidine-specific methyltransferase [Suillus fuscotomentosus]
MNTLQIVDVRFHDKSSDAASDIQSQVIKGLMAATNEKTLPTLILYDERGLRLYDHITTKAPEYYLFGAEEQILQDYAGQIVDVMHQHTGGIVSEEVVLELGAGALRKTSHILHALTNLVPVVPSVVPITYYALDLEECELKRTLMELHESAVGSMLGSSFPDSSDTEITSPSTPGNIQTPLHLLFLGSSLGNFKRGEDAEFLRALPLESGRDTLLLGLDHDNGRKEIELAYNDPQGYTRDFILNGLKTAGRALGDESMFAEQNWEYVNTYNESKRCHEAYYRCTRTHDINPPMAPRPIQFLEGELVNMEMSHKYSEPDTYTLFTEGKLRPIQRWTDNTGRYSLWLLERPPFAFPLLDSPSVVPDHTTKFGIPSIEDWSDMWTAWDFVTLRMIPPAMLFQKPIDLRHICLFYLGHIPTFLDIHLSRLLDEPHTEPQEFKRGIDPNVDDPTQCNHPHSVVPTKDDDWPSLRSILAFRNRVRERLRKVYSDIAEGKVSLTRKVARVLFMTFEHEGLHIETLLYMLVQCAGTGTIPPPDFSPPHWEFLAAQWKRAPKPVVATVEIGPSTVTLGINDIEAEDTDPAKRCDVAGHIFGWDNESPTRQVEVKAFRIEWRPVTNGDFYQYYKGARQGKDRNGETCVRTLYGPVPIKIAWDWPILTCYENLSVYASTLLDKFSFGYEEGANVGFRNWHPVPATTGISKHGGKGHNGGAWEWTSTIFDKYDGFAASTLYPGYSADFFDESHNVVIGGSYATIPRISERRSVRNWYQRNYPYCWTSARIAYDV